MSDTNHVLSDSPQPPNSLAPTYIEQNVAGSQQLATARIQSSFAIARRFPRDIEMVRQNMLKECCRPSFCMPDMKKNGSSVALYRVPRAGTNIEGVTIRFAEMAARNFGNLTIELQPLGEDQTQRIYVVIATDFETNLTRSEIVNVPKTIERKFAKDTDVIISSRTNSKGHTVYTILATEDDIAMKRNALISKATRNLIMGFIPGWLVEECVQEIRATAAKKDAQDPDAAKRSLFDAFASVGVTALMLTEFIGHGNQLQPAELEELRGYFGGMREGYTTWAEIVASKDDDKDGGVAKQIEELLTASGRTPAQSRKLRSSYAGRPAELVKYLQEEATKKADTGATKETPAATDPTQGASSAEPSSANVAQGSMSANAPTQHSPQRDMVAPSSPASQSQPVTERPAERKQSSPPPPPPDQDW